jgi:hypothetical protein
MKCDRVWRGARHAAMAAARPGRWIVGNRPQAAKERRMFHAGSPPESPTVEAAEAIDRKRRRSKPRPVDCRAHLVHRSGSAPLHQRISRGQ